MYGRNSKNQVSVFDIKFIRPDQKDVRLARQAIPTLCLISPDKLDIERH